MIRVPLFVTAVAIAIPAGAQTSTAVATPPALSPPARLSVPVMSTAVLPGNRLTIDVVEQHELPLVQVTVVVAGGSRLDGQHPGMASFVADMLDEGAGTRDADALQSQIAFLGATLSTSSDWDRITVSLKVPVRSLSPALDLLADVVLRPTFHVAEVRRQRDLRLTDLLQARDEPATVASFAFASQLYSLGHPYHRPAIGDSISVAAFDSATVRAFYQSTIRPERTTVIVVGDIGTARARAEIMQHFAAWRDVGPAAVAPTVSPAPGEQATRVVLVDKPGAAQSVIMIGWPGMERRSQDYPAVIVMNTILGGAFTSRLNMTLREAKGYSYGASSAFAFRQVPGPFVAYAAVRTNVTDSSLVEFFKELQAIRDTPVAPDELERAKNNVELQLPQTLESTTQVANQIASLSVFGLTLDDLPKFAEAVRNVTSADVQRVARLYLLPDRALVVVVGDLAAVRAPIEALRLGPTTELSAAAVVR